MPKPNSPYPNFEPYLPSFQPRLFVLNDTQFFTLIFIIVALQCCWFLLYRTVNHLYVCICVYLPSFLDFLPIYATTEPWVGFPELYISSHLSAVHSLGVCFMHSVNSVYMSTPVSQFIPPSLSCFGVHISSFPPASLDAISSPSMRRNACGQIRYALRASWKVLHARAKLLDVSCTLPSHSLVGAKGIMEASSTQVNEASSLTVSVDFTEMVFCFCFCFLTYCIFFSCFSNFKLFILYWGIKTINNVVVLLGE